MRFILREHVPIPEEFMFDEKAVSMEDTHTVYENGLSSVRFLSFKRISCSRSLPSDRDASAKASGAVFCLVSSSASARIASRLCVGSRIPPSAPRPFS